MTCNNILVSFANDENNETFRIDLVIKIDQDRHLSLFSLRRSTEIRIVDWILSILQQHPELKLVYEKDNETFLIDFIIAIVQDQHLRLLNSRGSLEVRIVD